MTKNRLLHILLLLSLISLPACGREPDFGYGTPDTLPANTATPAEPLQQSTSTPLPETPTSTPWPFEPESLAIRLGSYLEKQDGSLDFWVYIINPNPGQVTDCNVSVLLFDEENNQLIDNQESCGIIEAYAEYWLVVAFDESFIPDDFTAYNIYAQAMTPGSKLLEGKLNDLPVTGQEGVEISASRVLPKVTVELNWDQPQREYLPGSEIEAQMETRLIKGQLEEYLLCLQIMEKRDYGGDQTSTVKLAESCQPAYGEPSGEDQQVLTLSFLPTGYTWIQQEDSAGDYIPLEISARAEVLLGGVPLAEMERVLYLPPVEVETASWSDSGHEVDAVRPETPYQVNLKLKSLADDPNTHSVQVSVRYTEHDPEEWLVSGLLLFIPCLFGFCEDEAVLYTQEDQVTLKEDAEYLYTIPIQLPEGPTGESGIGGYYYLALTFDGVSIWRGAKVPLETTD
jgi:hypothetical protein